MVGVWRLLSGVASRREARGVKAAHMAAASLVTGTGRCQSPRLGLFPVVLGDGGNVRLLNHVRLVSDEEAEMRREGLRKAPCLRR